LPTATSNMRECFPPRRMPPPPWRASKRPTAGLKSLLHVLRIDFGHKRRSPTLRLTQRTHSSRYAPPITQVCWYLGQWRIVACLVSKQSTSRPGHIRALAMERKTSHRCEQIVAQNTTTWRPKVTWSIRDLWLGRSTVLEHVWEGWQHHSFGEGLPNSLK